VFAVLGDGAMVFFALAFVFLFFAKTRKSGICMAISIGIAAIFTNLTLKPMVARPRPYASGIEDFIEWWEYVGAHKHSEFSFPSGHTTSAMAAMLALCLCICLFNGKENNKKYRWVMIPAALCVILMGASRNYIMVHYPSDIVGGIIAGGIGALLGFLLIHFLYKGFEGNKDNKVCAFMLNSDIRNLFKKK
jgi:undecaprenyl-diphosphatase